MSVTLFVNHCLFNIQFTKDTAERSFPNDVNLPRTALQDVTDSVFCVEVFVGVSLQFEENQLKNYYKYTVHV